MALLLNGKMPQELKPFLMLWGVNALLNANDTQCANVCFVAGWLRLREVQKFMYSLKNVLKGLNTLTSSGCIA
jgi:hypothetical protein